MEGRSTRARWAAAVAAHAQKIREQSLYDLFLGLTNLEFLQRAMLRWGLINERTSGAARNYVREEQLFAMHRLLITMPPLSSGSFSGATNTVHASPSQHLSH